MIHLSRELFATFVIAQPVVEIPFLPNDAVLAWLERMEMIGHQQKQRDVPALFGLVESG